MADKKVDSTRVVAGGWRISRVSRCLRVSRAHLHAMARRLKNWQDRRPGVSLMILKRRTVSIMLSAICRRMVIVGSGHCCADNQKLTTWPLSMSDAYTASCVRMRCCPGVGL